MSLLQYNLDHSRAAYRFAVQAIPSELPAFIHGFQFVKQSQIDSMVIELGWAFFCRYEACVEAYLKSKGVNLSKKVSLLDWLKEQNVCIPNHYAEGLSLYRKIRNKLHHEDGAARCVNGKEDEEIHLLPEHMENFYNLFVWCGKEVEKCVNNSV